MTTRNPRLLLADVLGSAADARSFVTGMTFHEYRADKRTMKAVERSLMIVGEALSQLRQSEPALAGRISVLRDVINLRHILVHAYAHLLAERLWSIVQDFLPALEDEVAALLRDLGPS